MSSDKEKFFQPKNLTDVQGPGNKNNARMYPLNPTTITLIIGLLGSISKKC